ncbi:MAG: cupin domain-containing protein [Actinobacteria bacterium]|nr:cupin domain-containing protein [Actinomycetota bacterium]
MATMTDTTKALRFLDGYASILIGKASGGASVIELVMPQGSESPVHAHDEDETVVLLEGEVAFRIDGAIVRPDERGKIVLPQGVPHGYRVESADARWLSITAGRYEGFVRSVARPLTSPPRPLDLAQAVALTVAATEHGIELLSPAPAAAPAPRTPSLMERLHGALAPAHHWSPVAA